MTQAAAGPASIPTTLDGPPSGNRIAEANAAFQALLDQRIGDAPKPRPSGKNDGQLSREEDVRRRSPTLDPTAAAVAELASPGPVKPVIAQAQAIESGQAESGPAANAGPARASSRPTASSNGTGADRALGLKPQADEPPSRVAADARASAASSAKSEAQPRAAKAEPAQASKGIQPAAAPRNSPVTALPKAAIPAASTQAPIAARSTTSAAVRGGSPATKPGQARAAVKVDRPQPRFKLEPEEEKIAAQFGRGMAAALRQNGGSVTIRLQPEALGDLKIKMSLEPGKVAASFEVQTDQARHLLGKTMDTLRTALEARGLEVDRLDVQVADRAHPAQTGESFGGADADPNKGGGSGWEHPEPRTAQTAWMPVGRESAEPAESSGPWMGSVTGGALRMRLDALA